MAGKVALIGGGSWGTALAQLLAGNGWEPWIYLRDSEQYRGINRDHINYKYFPDRRLSERISASLDLEEVCTGAGVIFLTVPTHATREVMVRLTPYLQDVSLLVSTAKGFEEGTHLRNSEIMKEYTDLPVVVLSGPTHAEEVIEGLPSAVVAAARDSMLANQIQDMLMSSTFRVYTNPDVIGVELGGAIKNIMALAAGVCDGLGYGDNSRAALITRGLHEMSRLGVHFGGKLLTFAGLTGMGDLVVTCTSMHSRNRRLGILIGRGYSLEEALYEVNQVVEGVRTTRAVYNWYRDGSYDFELPITHQAYQVLFQGKDPLQAVNDLMVRGPKHEIEEVVNDIGWQNGWREG